MENKKINIELSAIREERNDPNFGIRSANDAIKLANVNNDKSQLDRPLRTSRTSSSARLSKSKIIKKHAIHLIRFCLKSGIMENNNIIQFLKENGVVLPNRTYDRYKSIAEKELEINLDADIWLSEKVQTGLVIDYKEISDRYNRQLVLDDMLTQSLVRQAIDKAVQYDNDPDKYYRYLDMNEMMKIQAISNYTMKNKLELISRGFMVYKIKQHIEYLQNLVRQKQSKIESKEGDVDISSRLSFLSKSYPTPAKVEYQSSNNKPENGEYDPEYLAQSDLVIGMNGRPIKKYLAEIEKKLGKALSTI